MATDLSTPLPKNLPRTAPILLQEGIGHIIFEEETFAHFLALERKRSDRSSNPMVVILLELKKLRDDAGRLDPVLRDSIFSALSSCLRETDIIGWKENDKVAAALLTELGSADRTAVIRAVREKLFDSLSRSLPAGFLQQITMTVHFYPEAREDGQAGIFNTVFYPDVTRHSLPRRFSLTIKRMIDLVGSAVLLVFFSPLMVLIALAVKMTSEGPVFFRQERLGHFGKPFQLLKFRSMRVDADPKIHEEYIEQFIKKSREGDSDSVKHDGIFKLSRDPRVTSIGRFLRKTSLDELPQFWNVLKGELSLVGPRPPIAYELDRYDPWHRRRILEVKPGITGLWQVEARSRTSFDEMVRLDLRYAREWSLWLDIVILLKTPWAVLKGDGAC
ncbi:MAG TPA: sugar transferase [Acidobacteriota bacterium]|nr:sugar transferase [Acidobacteriota bacterium]